MPDAILIETVEHTGSTNADLLVRLRAGESIAEGYWLRAARQSGGRGRNGRAWVSPPGNVYASTAVNVLATDPAPHTLSFVAGMATLLFVRSGLAADMQSRALLKWPNDVLVSGAKIAGMLLEREGDTIVVGIGINLAHAPTVSDRETTSLRDLNATYDTDPGAAVGSLASYFSRELALWREDGVSPLLARWTAAAHPIGAPISAQGPDGSALFGQFDGLSGDGALRLRLANGEVRSIHAGDIEMIAAGDGRPPEG